MRVIFVSRHTGALAWLSDQGLRVGRVVPHLDIAEVQAGDTVIGTLPIHIAAAVCALGGRFFNLILDMPPDSRGRELTSSELTTFGARVEEFLVVPLSNSSNLLRQCVSADMQLVEESVAKRRAENDAALALTSDRDLHDPEPKFPSWASAKRNEKDK